MSISVGCLYFRHSGSAHRTHSGKHPHVNAASVCCTVRWEPMDSKGKRPQGINTLRTFGGMWLMTRINVKEIYVLLCITANWLRWAKVLAGPGAAAGGWSVWVPAMKMNKCEVTTKSVLSFESPKVFSSLLTWLLISGKNSDVTLWIII